MRVVKRRYAILWIRDDHRRDEERHELSSLYARAASADRRWQSQGAGLFPQGDTAKRKGIRGQLPQARQGTPRVYAGFFPELYEGAQMARYRFPHSVVPRAKAAYLPAPESY